MSSIFNALLLAGGCLLLLLMASLITAVIWGMVVAVMGEAKLRRDYIAWKHEIELNNSQREGQPHEETRD